MQVDEQSKVEFENSEDEREFKEQQKNWCQASFTWKEAEMKSKAQGSVLMVMNGVAAQTMIKIAYEDLELVGEGLGEHRKEVDDEIKADCIGKLYKLKEGVYCFIPEAEKFKSGYIN